MNQLIHKLSIIQIQKLIDRRW